MDNELHALEGNHPIMVIGIDIAHTRDISARVLLTLDEDIHLIRKTIEGGLRHDVLYPPDCKVFQKDQRIRRKRGGGDWDARGRRR